MNMIKTVKVKKQMYLDELIRYVRENHIGGEHYKEYFSDCRVYLLCINGYKLDYFLKDKTVGLQSGKYPNMPLDTTFTIEVEEDITEDTVFEEVYRVTKEGDVTIDKNKSINSCLDWKDYQVQIFAMLDGKLQLIWEADSDEL